METTYDFDNYFEHKQLDKIYGEPDTRSLQKVFKQLKRNARSIPSTLGGGQYGHLFMVIPPAEWNNLPGAVAVVPPRDPGPFALRGGLTASEIAVGQKNHDENKRKYNHFQALKRILRNQLVAAIDPEYLDPIRCDLTDMVNRDITEIIDFLQESYGQMTVNEIEEATSTIKNFTYEPTKSINILLTAVQEHADLVKIAGAPLNDTQIQALAYFLISKYRIFQDALVAWNKLPQPKTWNDMKNHMRKEYKMLKDINALSIQDSALNTTDMMNELKEHQESLLLTAEKRFKTGLTEVMNMAILDLDGKANTKEEPTEQANNTAEIDALKLEVKKLHSQLQNSKQRSNQTTFSEPYFDPNRARNNFNPRYRRNNTNRQYYCWTHGAGHSGWQCKNPAQGHQPQATFLNRMGGNNFGCFNTKPQSFNNQSTSSV